MGFLSWLCRSVPGLSFLAWTLLAFLALGHRLPIWSKSQSSATELHHLTTSQLFYVIYTVLCHLLGCVGFPLRLCWSVWHIGGEVKRARFEAEMLSFPAEKEGGSEKSLSLSANSSRDSTGDGPLSRASTPRIPSFDSQDQILHAIIIPSYKEDIDTMRETLAVLASHSMAKSSYDVYLAMEQRDPDAENTAVQLIKIFSSKFRTISFTLHPGDISGEVAGKSSNVSWAARQLSHNYMDNELRKRCIITVMDSDTHLKSSYFILMTQHHRENLHKAATTMYVTPIIFDRNSHMVNPLVRTADIFWCGAGLSGLYKGSPICIPTSVYSLAMTLAGQVGGWDTGADSIGEDLHMFLKCYFASSGRFHTKIIFSPASQSNVSSDSKGLRGALSNVKSRYKQAMRHMWGALDTGYAIEKALERLWKKNDEKLSGWLSNTNDPAERVPTWINDTNLKHFTPPNLPSDLPSTPKSTPSMSPLSLIILFHRLYEAHFLPAHVTVGLFSGIIYAALVPPVIIHPVILWALSFTGTLRFIGFCLLTFYMYLYESYHSLCVRTREEEMKKAGLYERMQGGFSHRTWRRNFIDYCLLPVTGTLFGTVPGVQAELSHFWTDRLVYTVSAKPQLRKDVEEELLLSHEEGGVELV